MTITYFDYTTDRLTTGTRARAGAVNDIFDEISDAFKMLYGFGTDSGAADAYVVTVPYTLSSYSDGMIVRFKASATNTGASTLNVNSVGAKALIRQSGAAAVAGDVVADKMTWCMYNSTSDSFEIVSAIADVALANAIASIAALVASSGVKISLNDSTVGVINGKLVMGDNLSGVENNDGGDETYTINAVTYDSSKFDVVSSVVYARDIEFQTFASSIM